MRTCAYCYWAKPSGVLLGKFDITFGCKKQEPYEWVDSMMVPVELPCPSFATPEEMRRRIHVP